MTDRDRRPFSGEQDHPINDENAPDVDEIGLNRAGLGSPPADIDASHRPDLFDIDATRLPSAGLAEDPGTAGGLGSGLGDTRDAPFASRPIGGAGVGGPGPGAARRGAPRASASSDDADPEEIDTLAEETGATTRAVGSVDPQDTDAEPGGVDESDMGAVSISGAKRPGAGLGETRGGHPGPVPDTV